MEENDNQTRGILDKIQVRDVALAFLCGIAIYLLRTKELYDFKPCWRHDIDSDKTDVSNYQLLPLVTDLDGDGEVEIVILNTLGELKVLLPIKTELTTKILPPVKIRYGTTLPKSIEKDGARMSPVAMNTGYLLPYSSVSKRSQVIVVVFSNWHVMCFSHQLNLLWKQTLTAVSGSLMQYEAQAFTVLVIPHSIHKHSNGTVIVGGSFEHQSHHVYKREDNKKQYRGQRGATSATPGKTESLGDNLKHFSSFALSGYNGSVLWHHLPGDFENKEKDTEEKTFHWKLKLKRSKLHVGEEHWSKYRKNILKALPHRWHDLTDTRMEIANIKSGKMNTQEHDSETQDSGLSGILALHDFHIVGKNYGGMKPHTRHEHITNPNVLIIYHHKGVEVLNFQSGHPLTGLQLQTSRSTYVDVNNDGYLDQVEAYFNNDCTGIVSTVDEVEEVLYHWPICSSPGWISSVSLSNIFSPDYKVSEDTHVAIPPVVIPSIATQTGFLRHLQGYSLTAFNRGYDTVFITSNGIISSFSPRGDFNWQVKTNAGWAAIASKAQNGGINEHEGTIYSDVFKPTAVPIAMRIYGRLNAVVLTGWSTMTVVSLKDGSVLAEHSLPCQPTIRPIAADFNNDGYTDIIYVCPFGYVGFTLKPVVNIQYTVIVSIGVILSVMVLHWTCVASGPEDERLKELNE